MTAANKLIDKAKDMCDGRSYAALARQLKVTPQSLHQWKNGDVPLPTERIVEIAKIAHAPLDEWVLRILSEQSKGEARKVLEGVTKRMGYAAMVLLCAMGLATGNPAKAAPGKAFNASTTSAIAEQCLLCSRACRYYLMLLRLLLERLLQRHRPRKESGSIDACTSI